MLFIALGLVRVFSDDVLNGLWIAGIGLFLDNAARTAQKQVGVRRLLQGFVVGDVMTHGGNILSTGLTLDLVAEELRANGEGSYVVGSSGRIVGLVTPACLRQVPRSRWPETHLHDVLIPLADLKQVAPDTSLDRVLQQMAADDLTQLPVILNGVFMGIVTRDGLMAFIRKRAEFGLG